MPDSRARSRSARRRKRIAALLPLLLVFCGCSTATSSHLYYYSDGALLARLRSSGYQGKLLSAWQNPQGTEVYLRGEDQTFFVLPVGSTESRSVQVPPGSQGEISYWLEHRRCIDSTVAPQLADRPFIFKVDSTGQAFLWSDAKTGLQNVATALNPGQIAFSVNPSQFLPEDLFVAGDRICLVNYNMRRSAGSALVKNCWVFRRHGSAWEKEREIALPGIFLRSDPFSDRVLLCQDIDFPFPPAVYLYDLSKESYTSLGWSAARYYFFLKGPLFAS